MEGGEVVVDVEESGWAGVAGGREVPGRVVDLKSLHHCSEKREKIGWARLGIVYLDIN